jgi:DNA-binding NarL/FixJ family response regulator
MSTEGERELSVLIADDDEVARETMKAILAGEDGIELVGVAADADEATSLARDHEPDVAVLDLDMPGGGGYAVALAIKDSGLRTRIVALTAIDTPDAQLDILRAGALGFVVKGSPRDEIVEAIRSAARW